MNTQKADFIVQCGCCENRYHNWTGSTPCCGSIAYIVEDGKVTNKLALFASINGGDINTIIIEQKTTPMNNTQTAGVWVKASENKPTRQVAAKRGEKYGILSPWFNDTFWFYTTDFADREAFDVTNELDGIYYLDESAPTLTIQQALEVWDDAREYYDGWVHDKRTYFLNKFGYDIEKMNQQ